MSITIKTEKIIVRGEQLRKIIDINMLKKEELPEAYTNGQSVYLVSLNRIAYKSWQSGWTLDEDYLCPNNSYEEERFQKILQTIKEYGKLLQVINDKLAKENADWHGEETFVI